MGVAVGVTPMVGVGVGFVCVGVTDGDGCTVGLTRGVGLTGTGVWFTGVGKVPPVLAVAVAVTPGEDETTTGGVGVDFLPNGPATSTTVTFTERLLTISSTLIICCPAVHPLSSSKALNPP